MTKNVVSGSLDFTLSSVMLEDGLPRRTDKEIFDEFMKDAMEWKKSQQKANKNRDREESSKSSTKKSSGHKAPVYTSTEEKRNETSPSGTDNKLNVPQEAAFCSDNNKEPMEIKRKATSPSSSAKLSSPPPLPRLTVPSPPTQQPAVASDGQLKFDVREVKSEKSCLSPKASPPSMEKSQEPGNQGDVVSSPSRRKRSRRKKKTSKSPKWLNPFSKQNNDEQSSVSFESESDPCKESPKKDFASSKCKNLDKGDGKEKWINNGDTIVPKNDSSNVVEGGAVEKGSVVLCSTPVESVLKRAKPEYEKDKGDKSDDYHSSPGLGTSPSNGSTLDEARPIPPVDASRFEKETPVYQEAVSVVGQNFPELSQYAKEQTYLLKGKI